MHNGLRGSGRTTRMVEDILRTVVSMLNNPVNRRRDILITAYNRNCVAMIKRMIIDILRSSDIEDTLLSFSTKQDDIIFTKANIRIFIRSTSAPVSYILDYGNPIKEPWGNLVYGHDMLLFEDHTVQDYA